MVCAKLSGLLTDADLKEMFDSGVFGDMIWRIGDINNDSKKLDVGDIMAIKNIIMSA